MTPTNPFIQRGRITAPEQFAGRWAELSLIFERIEAGRPVLISGVPGIGKSSLLTHIVQSAAVNLEQPDMRAFYLDLAGAGEAADVYDTVIAALGGRGDTPAALEVALVDRSAPTLLCLDNAQVPLAAGWGERLLEVLARIARSGGLLLVVAVVGAAPALSERFATIGLGALAATEVRLLTEAYLDDTSISFTPAELNEITRLSAGHPAYVQRAAYHLFQNKLNPGFDWRAAYLAEARTQPVPGAPLPPAIFEGRGQGRTAESSYGDEQGAGSQAALELLPLPGTPPLLPWAIPVLGALLLLTTTGSIALALLAAGVGAAGALLWARRGRS
jgi:hypothetical protein